MGIVVPETCWAYKKYNKIISSIYLVLILQLLPLYYFFLVCVGLMELQQRQFTHSKPFNKIDENKPFTPNCSTPTYIFEMQFCTFHFLYKLLVTTHNQPNNVLRMWRDRAWSTNSCLSVCGKRMMRLPIISSSQVGHIPFNPLALELDIYSSAHDLCKMWIFCEPRRVTLGNTRHFVEK